jgi:ABC-type antimicrobial peptide transport system permease subunit
MSPIIRGNIQMAIASIRSTRWRSFLTMFGVVVAVVPVLTILSIGEGVKRQINDQIKDLGTNLVTIRPGRLTTSNNTIEQFNALNGFSTDGTFTKKDLKAVQDTKVFNEISPLGIVPGAVSINDETIENTFCTREHRRLAHS